MPATTWADPNADNVVRVFPARHAGTDATREQPHDR